MAESPVSNNPELSVSELAAALKRTVEDRFGLVRVRGDQLTLLRIEPSKPIREAEQALEGLP